ncbi:hypothetical protein Bb109J_c0291 [Bdellovibrio bacteriovorus]|uniref:hypothetical protein n=1 Tax=Bdellovibrio bacteriovorus TaxID=959 RepID=UPI00045BE269|nr:hypothetical protein [Bdellovibrio bacteriovorus]AHZ85949.1 hypothetical protein EP01_13535 [Bdellovibrio bacteriovorus]BEV66871.1 hypothetical protein Bb109J_c0291 [Bdellovibrio bacteriovorus]
MFQSLSKALLSVLVLGSGLVGCASVNSVSLTPIPANRNTPVKAEVSRWIILGFNFDNDYIDPLVEDLKRQCPNGVVSGILTKDETIAYLLVFKKHVVTTGFCNTAPAAKAVTTKKAENS